MIAHILLAWLLVSLIVSPIVGRMLREARIRDEVAARADELIEALEREGKV